MEKPKTKQKLKPGQITAERAYKLSDSLAKASERPVRFGSAQQAKSDLRSKEADRLKSQMLKKKADEAIKKSGGVIREYRMDVSSANKTMGIDMPLPSSSQLFDA
jgi:hypothetical protein